jgi:hypothetical protein
MPGARIRLQHPCAAALDLSDPAWAPLMQEGGGPKNRRLFCANVIHIAPWRVAEGLSPEPRYCGPTAAVPLWSL